MSNNADSVANADLGLRDLFNHPNIRYATKVLLRYILRGSASPGLNKSGDALLVVFIQQVNPLPGGQGYGCVPVLTRYGDNLPAVIPVDNIAQVGFDQLAIF